MFKSADLPFVVEFFLMFYADKPIDWLLDHLLWVKVCNPEKDNVSPFFKQKCFIFFILCELFKVFVAHENGFHFDHTNRLT